jgi:hypothetical protein
MAASSTASPLSGEIMTVAIPSRPRRRFVTVPDVVGAEFETVRDDALPARPPQPAASDGRAGLGILMPGDGAGHGARPGGPVFWSLGLAAVLAAFWVAGGHQILDERGGLGGSAGFVLSDVRSVIDASGQRALLRVDGTASNAGADPAAMPPLEIRVADTSGRVTRYKLGTEARTVAPGETLSFASLLEVPSAGVGKVTLRFAP